MERQQKEIEQTINALWELHDSAEKSGNRDLAADFASRALKLLGKLPENLVHVVSTELQ